MAKGWRGFDGGFCVDHTIELSVKNYTGAEGVKDTFTRAKGIVAYFNRSTSGINDLKTIQAASDLPQRKPVMDVATRWFSSYNMMNWFREQQQAVQMYDVRHGAEASKNDAYKANRLQLDDWNIIEQSMAVLKQAAEVTKMLEGTQYVTISMVLPSIHRLIESTSDGPLYMPWKPQALMWLDKRQIHPKVRAARSLLNKDLETRWINDLPPAARDELDIATMLDPRFKTYNFPGLKSSSLESEYAAAKASLDLVWTMDWKPKESQGGLQAPATPAPPSPPKKTAAKTPSTASSIFATPLAPEEMSTHSPGSSASATPPTDTRDDLEKYLSLPAETNLDLDVLEWWKVRDHSLPPDIHIGRPQGLPTLAKMARQYLGRPASSAGVERMFSKAGKLHDDLKASQNDETLEHALLAAVNCP